MRNHLFWIVLVGCSGSGTGTGGHVDAANDGVSGSGDGNRSDAASVSHAPCATCCDPIAQNCPTGQACYENAQFNGTYCDTVGVFPVDHSCYASPGSDPTFHCVAGDTCLVVGTNQSCRAFCVTNTDCAGTPHPTCVLYTVPAGRNPYGLCI